jgi:hypothetical protein
MKFFSFSNQIWETPMYRLLRSVLVGVCGLAISSLILLAAYGSGSRLVINTDNLWRLMRLTVPFALLLAALAALLPNIKESRSFRSWLTLIICGSIFSFLYFFVVARIVDFPSSLATQALACWLASAVASLFLVLQRRVPAAISATLVCLIAILVPVRVFNLVAHNQLLTVAIVVPEGIMAQFLSTGLDLIPKPRARHRQKGFWNASGHLASKEITKSSTKPDRVKENRVLR